MFRIAIERTALLTALLAAGLAGCGDLQDDADFVTGAALGDRIPGTSTTDANFAAFATNFKAAEALADGLGPIFNERACGNCHNQGASGGAGRQIERRYGRFVNGVFDPLAGNGGSLRQLFAAGQNGNNCGTPGQVCTFTGSNGQTCRVTVESEPATATVHNVGRVTTPLFGLGLVDAMPDSFFDNLVAAEPAAIRGVVNHVSIVLPNDRDASQVPGGTRVGRFGWKAGVPNLAQFAADAYMNEMGITTQHCFRGTSITAFATESAPNGIPQPAGCDDLVPGTDDSVGSCAGGLTKLQKDVDNFKRFMTNLAPPPRDTSNATQVARGQTQFDNVGCAGCHTRQVFTTPSPTANGINGGFNFQPFSDFAAHDMGTLGDQIGNAGDSLAVTRRMRTAPLWGLRFRPLLLHDGRTGDVATAIRAHDGQGAAARNAFNALSAASQADLVAFVRSL